MTNNLSFSIFQERSSQHYNKLPAEEKKKKKWPFCISWTSSRPISQDAYHELSQQEPELPRSYLIKGCQRSFFLFFFLRLRLPLYILNAFRNKLSVLSVLLCLYTGRFVADCVHKWTASGLLFFFAKLLHAKPSKHTNGESVIVITCNVVVCNRAG